MDAPPRTLAELCQAVQHFRATAAQLPVPEPQHARYPLLLCRYRVYQICSGVLYCAAQVLPAKCAVCRAKPPLYRCCSRRCRSLPYSTPLAAAAAANLLGQAYLCCPGPCRLVCCTFLATTLPTPDSAQELSSHHSVTPTHSMHALSPAPYPQLTAVPQAALGPET